MPDNKQAADVARYAAAVRAALAPLPDSERESLLEDLEDHLAEVASESDVPLRERLGKPEDYAAELRSAYVGAESTTRRRLFRDTLRALISSVIGTKAYREMRVLLPELRPGWWILRAYLAVLVLTFLFSTGQNLRPIPNPFSSGGLLQILATLIAIAISVRLGRRGRPRSIGWRGAALVANIAIALFALPVLVSMSTNHGYAIAEPPHQYFRAVEAGYYATGSFTNVYPYTSDGRPLKDILLYDQNGRPLAIAPLKYPDVITDYPVGTDGRPIINEYPLKQRRPDGLPIPPPRVALPPSSAAPATTSPTPAPTP
jgi:uncharacterized membrane protein